MATQLQLRRGTTEQNANFVGAQGEITMDIDTNELRVHNGTTAGGAAIIDTIVAFQRPTEENGYTWYRRYSSGWIEQGGINNTDTLIYVKPMADTNYIMILQPMNTSGFYAMSCENLTTTGAEIHTAAPQWHNYSWQVSGMAA